MLPNLWLVGGVTGALAFAALSRSSTGTAGSICSTCGIQVRWRLAQLSAAVVVVADLVVPPPPPLLLLPLWCDVIEEALGVSRHEVLLIHATIVNPTGYRSHTL